MTSILKRVRNDGFRDGYSQASQVIYDDAYEKGRREWLRQGEQNTRRWGWFCFICGIGLAMLVMRLFL